MEEQRIPPIGQPAPEIDLPSSTGGIFRLREQEDKNTILAFYPADWSSVCGDQMSLYNEVLFMFEDLDAQLVGISVDGIWSHRAFAEVRNLRFPLLSDFEPKGEVARRYGVYRDEEGTSERALFVVDSKGIIRWSFVSPIGVNPGADGILNVLEAISEEEH